MAMSRVASIFGWIFLIAGIAGFIPGVTYHSYLLGIFHVNSVHNIVHIITGIIFLWAGRTSECTSLRSLQVFGVIYGLITIAGLVLFHRLMLGPLAINGADTVYHLVVSVIFLYYGFLSSARYSLECGAAASH